jgi:hypothetical protein
MHMIDDHGIVRWFSSELNARKATCLSRGMRDMRLDAAPLKFADLFKTNELPSLPSQWGHDWLGVNWGMYGNDHAGNCVAAGGGHENMYWSLATRKQMPRFTNTSLRNYSDMLVASGHPPYDIHDPTTDLGLDPIAAAEFRRKVGLLDDTGLRHKDDAYVGISNLHYAFVASYTLGISGFGFQLPDTAEDEFAAKRPWADTTRPPSGGHYVPLVGCNSQGYYVFITWGGYQAATPAWVAKYFVGAVGYVNQEYLRVDGTTPEGFNEAALNDYLMSLKQ